MRKLLVIFTLFTSMNALALEYQFDCKTSSGDRFFFIVPRNDDPMKFFYQKSGERSLSKIPGCSKTDDYRRNWSYYLKGISANCNDLITLEIETDVSAGENSDFLGIIHFPNGLLGYSADLEIKLGCKMSKIP